VPSSIDRDAARALFLRAFRWTHGHADLSGVFGDAALLAAAGPVLAQPFRDVQVSSVIALEARGFVLGALVAREMGVGLVFARKPGSVHPGSFAESSTAPDWRGVEVTVRIVREAVSAGDALLLVDDWIETGTQARTVRSALERVSARLVGVSVLVDDTDADTREGLGVNGLVRSGELPPST
jgi:adenine phosphoribosyltransferase